MTKCIETQSYSLKEDGNFDIKVSVNPENPLGQIFSIVANWSVRADKETTVVDITLEIECKKRLWGVREWKATYLLLTANRVMETVWWKVCAFCSRNMVCFFFFFV